MTIFDQKKMCAFQRSSGLVVIRQVAQLSWYTNDVRTPWARHNVATGPPGPRRAPTAARRPADGTVRLVFIGGPRFGRPATPIGAGQGYCPKKSNNMPQNR